MKKLEKKPIEIFCHDYETRDCCFNTAFAQQYCKFIKGTCVKPRKSQPEIKVGICTVGSTVNKEKEVKPVIICPQRFKEESMFETIREKYLSSWKNVKWVQEVNIGVGGNIDYVAVEVDNNDNIQDFLCVEIQAGGTTGTPYPYIQELKQHGKFLEDSHHTYGINWANEFSKTMMQQAYKKGKIVQHWNRKIVFVLQDVAMDYIRATADCSLLTEYDKNSPVDFCTFSLVWNNNQWKLTFNNICSSSLEGINRILGGATVEDYLTEEEFVSNIRQKGLVDGVFLKNVK